MNNNNNTNSGGIGFVGLLTVAFIFLKLCNVITWSWWWVLSPMWISAIIGILIVTVCIVIMVKEDKSYTRRNGKWKF